MSNLIELYRDELQVNDELVSRLSTGSYKGRAIPAPGDTIVLGARRISYDLREDIYPGCNLILLADTIHMGRGAVISNTGAEDNESPAITVIAKTLEGPNTLLEAENLSNGNLHTHNQTPFHPSLTGQQIPALNGRENLRIEEFKVVSNGLVGKDGKRGKVGHEEWSSSGDTAQLPGQHTHQQSSPRKEPVHGTNGKPGAAGGIVTVYYAKSKVPVTLISKGGQGGKGGDGSLGLGHNPPEWIPIPAQPGDGGHGGHGGRIVASTCAKARQPKMTSMGGEGGRGGVMVGGVNGDDGRKGMGVATICSILGATDDLWKLIPDSRIAANWAKYRTEFGWYLFRRFDARSRRLAITEFETAIKLDPNVPTAQQALQRLLFAQTPFGHPRDLDVGPDYQDLAVDLSSNIGNVIAAFQAAQSADISAVIWDTAATHLESDRDRTSAEIRRAVQEIEIALAMEKKANELVDSIQAQIDAASANDFTFMDVLTTVGAIAAAVASIIGGVTAVVSVPAALVAVGKLAESSQNLSEFLKQEELKKDAENLKKGLEGFPAIVKGIVSLIKLIEQLREASEKEGQEEIGGLLVQLAQAQWDRIVAVLRQKQSQDYVTGLGLALQRIEIAIADLKAMSDNGIAESLQLLFEARALADMVALRLFIAHRALELYELDEPAIRFDYGIISPDREHDCLELMPTAHEVITESTSSVLDMPATYQTWDQIYRWVNVVQSDYDVVHNDLLVTIAADESIRNGLQPGNALYFEVPLTAFSSSFFETKVNGLTIELRGATASGIVLLWVQHSGQWAMRRRKDGAIVNNYLYPRREICNLSSSTNALAGSIPEFPPSASEPGPPFGFWGRGLAAKWVLYLDPETPSTVNLNVNNLTELVIRFRGVSFSPRQAIAPPPPSLALKAKPLQAYKSPIALVSTPG